MVRMLLPGLLILYGSSFVFAQAEPEKVLLIRHIESKKQHYFSKGNKIKVFVAQDKKIKGIITSISDSSLTINDNTVLLQDIKKIKRPSGNNIYTQVFASLIILEGIILVSLTGGDYAIIGMTSILLGLPVLVKPGFIIGENCQLEVATKIH